MPNIEPVDPAKAEGKTKELLDKVSQKFGRIPNIFKVMGHSPAVLESYLAQSSALESTTINPKLKERIALAVAQTNQCDYCLAAHSAIGQSLGLAAEEMLKNRRYTSDCKKSEAALAFVRILLDTKGSVPSKDIAALKSAGFDSTQIMEIVGVVAQNLLTNFVNHAADTAVDFPAAPKI
ncbi:MAG: carboxymuconolactone decarboxylase family protein [Candidatus Omnitrophica bacterium]|nr:carboxymuconolactone decarboxylase family protein [Candidatus Omnitrophota bacterium]